MCGVVAYHSPNPAAYHFDILTNIMKESEIRGMHAYGMSWLGRGEELRSMKTHRLPELSSTIGSPAFQANLPRALVAHNRYSTSGDWQDHANNQPIVAFEGSNKYSLVFNGVVDQGERKDWEKKFGGRYSTDNDGEIVLRKMMENALEFEKWFGKQKFSFAGAFLIEREGLFILRNRSRPLWKADADSAVFFASTRDILRRAGAPGEYSEVPPFVVLRFAKVA